MKRFAYAFAIFIFAFTAFAVAQPKLEIDNDGTYDWGNVKSTESPLKAKIKLWNKGNETLIINNVKPGCGCTTAPLDQDHIEAGKFATLDVSLNIGSHGGMLQKSITVTSNDPQASTKLIILKANVVVPISLLPNYISFPRLYVGEEATSKVVITNNTDKAVKITSIKVEPSNLNINIKSGEVIMPKNSVTLEASYKPTEVGQFNGTISMNTDNSDVPVIDIRGWGNIIKKEMPNEAPAASTHGMKK